MGSRCWGRRHVRPPWGGWVVQKTLGRVGDAGALGQVQERPARIGALLIALCCATALAGCGGGEAPRTAAPTPAAAAPAPATVSRAVTAPTATPATAAHDDYAAKNIACAACHPCGAKATHPVAWMDQQSSGFHAVSANSGLASCQACHGANLDGVGTTTTISCAQCHGASWKTSCTMCHGGTDGTTGAPPRATWGNGADTTRVGAHTSHLAATHALAQPIACEVCHVKPSDALSTGHIDGGTAEVVFSGLAAQASGAAWNRAAATCASTYRHGATLLGGTKTAPVWTATDGSQIGCGACHGVPPPAPHVQNAACGSCHPGYTNTSVNSATHVDGKLDLAAMTCSSCHGSATNAAPPAGTHGETASSALAVGAHQQHLAGGSTGNAIACSECHLVPTSTAHANGTVELSWGSIATAGGAQPRFDAATATCASTYCHGQFTGGNALNAPVWTVVDGSQKACGTCHGVPPPAPHVASTDCASCHTGYTATSVNLASHLNGRVDVVALTCTTCHGTAGVNAAPPRGTHGEVATTDLAVGAHQAHLSGAKLGKAVACAECHVVPSSPGHSNGTIDLTWGTLATTSGAQPRFDAATATCASTYCHGATLNAGGSVTAPVWTKVDGTQAACGACHGVPPPAPHVQNAACGSCHTGYTATAVNASLHLNGKVDVVSLTCSSCHGSTANAAPPLGTAGETATTAVGVGAHQQHLAGSALAGPIACGECHTVPTSTAHSNGTVDLTWGAIAITGGAKPAFDAATATCASTYCHGQFTGGNVLNAPVWTVVGGSQAACGSCHGVPPPAPHVASTDCGSCHTGYTATTVNAATHVDGKVDVIALACNTCHGSATSNAPPKGTHGETVTTSRAVGAHQAHLAGATCASTYCHGATLAAGGTLTAPVWTTVDGTQDACGTCHGSPPPAPHVQNTACGSCHAGYTQSAVNLATHIDGKLDVVALACNTCHGSATSNAPPVGTRGETSTTARAVGAHQVHLSSTLGKPVACAECHTVPTAMNHANGSVQVAFGSLTKTGGANPIWNGAICASTYCHGATLAAGGTLQTPTWTTVNGTQDACGTCHGIPPPAPHVQNTSCGSCHACDTQTTVNLATHIDGKLDLVTLSCNTCHGSATSNAPPVG